MPVVPVLVACLVLLVALVAPAHGAWPQAGGDPAHSGEAPGDPGDLPLERRWTAEDGAVAAPPVITHGPDPRVQRVAYATTDGQVRLRRLEDGALLGAAAVAAPVGGLADSSSPLAPGELVVASGDGPAGVSVARLSLANGERTAPDLFLPGSAGHTSATPPLLERAALWVLGDRVAGATLWRIPAPGGEPVVVDLPGADGAVAPARFGAAVAVAAPDGVVLVGDDGAVTRVVLGCAPRALAAGHVLCDDGRVHRIGAEGAAASSSPLAGAPAGLAVSARGIVATTGEGLHVLEPGSLALRGMVPGPFGAVAPAITGARAHAGHATVDLTAPAASGAVEPGDRGQPAVSRGHVVVAAARGVTLDRDADTAPPAAGAPGPVTAGPLAGVVGFAVAADDARGVASVVFRLAVPRGAAHEIGRDGEADDRRPFLDAPGTTWSTTFQTASVPNGAYVLDAVVTDRSGLRTTTTPVTVDIANTTAVHGRLLRAGACANPLSGTDAGERLRGTAAGDRLLLGPGDDAADGLAGHDCLEGGPGDDHLDGGSAPDRLEGGDDDDRLYGRSGADVLTGDAGDDRLRGASGRDRLDGGAGDDDLRGGSGEDLLAGGPGNDRLAGGRGTDRLLGGAGDDRLVPGPGTSGVDGGPGDDAISAVNRRRDAIACGAGRDRVLADERDRVSRNCERVVRVRAAGRRRAAPQRRPR